MKSIAFTSLFAMTAVAAPATLVSSAASGVTDIVARAVPNSNAAHWKRSSATVEAYFGGGGLPYSHVGNLTGTALSSKFSEILSNTCRPECSGSNLSGGDCCSQKGTQIDSIYYDATGSLANNAHLTLTVTHWSFPDGHTGMREALISAVALAARKQTEDAKNCYQKNLSGQDLTFCNVSQQIGITVSGAEAWLIVWIQFNGDTTNQKSDCYAIEEAVRGGMYDEADVGDKFATGLGLAKDDISFTAKCKDIDDQDAQFHSMKVV